MSLAAPNEFQHCTDQCEYTTGCGNERDALVKLAGFESIGTHHTHHHATAMLITAPSRRNRPIILSTRRFIGE